MALMVHKSTLPQFEFSPNPEFDAEISAIKARYEDVMERIKTKKISAADVYYGGASITDEATQTEESEIVEIKNATETLSILTDDSKNLKARLEVFYESTMTEYQNLVNNKASLIYDQCAELLRDISRQNEASLERTRRAYKQQLADAIASLGQMYTKNMQLKLRTVELRQTDIADQYAAENLRLRDRIRQLEDQVTAVTGELTDIERAKALEWADGDEEMVSEAVSPFTESTKAGDAALQAKLQMQEATITDLRLRIADCEMLIQSRNKQIDQIEREFKELGSENTSANSEIGKLRMDKARLENELQTQAEKMKNQEEELRVKIKSEQNFVILESLAQSLNPEEVGELKQKLAEMELDIQAQVEAAKEQIKAEHQKESEKRFEDERARYVALAEEKRRIEAELAKERKAMLEKSKEDRDVDAMRSAKSRAEAEAERLRRDIDRIHRMWEKKFSILQSSLHALKDEMFVRRYLEKQAAQLHTSAVAFVFGKQAMHHAVPKIPDGTVRPKTMSGYSHDDLKPLSGHLSAFEGQNSSRGEPGQEGVAVPFKPPRGKKTVWDTRPPTQTSTNPTSARPDPHNPDLGTAD